jgi:hypothetical protein
MMIHHSWYTYGGQGSHNPLNVNGGEGASMGGSGEYKGSSSDQNCCGGNGGVGLWGFGGGGGGGGDWGIGVGSNGGGSGGSRVSYSVYGNSASNGIDGTGGGGGGCQEGATSGVGGKGTCLITYFLKESA